MGTSFPLVTTITIDGSLDSHALEALQLEVQQLANRCGLEVADIKVETVEKPLRKRRTGSFKPERHLKRSKQI